MKRSKRLRIAGLALAVAAMVTTTASARPAKTITIRHQMQGCHTWSFAGGPYSASLKVKVDRGTGLAFVNNDAMPHKLIKLSGPAATITGANMNHMSAKALVSFSKAGVYRFKTKAGEDYPSMGEMHTVGADNVLRLIVTVS